MSLMLLIDVLEKLLDDGSGPRVTGVGGDALIELSVSSLLLLVRHDQSLVDGVGYSVEVEGVDEQSRGERSCRSEEL